MQTPLAADANRRILKAIAITAMSFLGVITFYWYQLRPANVRSECSEQALENARSEYVRDNTYTLYGKENKPEPGLYKQTDYDSYYRICLHNKGF